MWHDVGVQSHFFARIYPDVPAPLLLERLFFAPFYCLGTLSENQFIIIERFISDLSFLSHVSICLSLCQDPTVLITIVLY